MSDLSERMAAVLRDIPNIDCLAERGKAYVAASIELHEISNDEARAADELAHSIVLAERLNGSPARR